MQMHHAESSAKEHVLNTYSIYVLEQRFLVCHTHASFGYELKTTGNVPNFFKLTLNTAALK